MTLHQLKSLCLKSLIGFLSLSALIAVASLLGGDFGSTQIKVILTTLTISGASICAMACFAFIEKRGLVIPGSAGVGCALLAAIMTITGIWNSFDGQFAWKLTLTLITLAAAFAHSFLLLIPTLDQRYRWSQTALVAFVVLLASMILLAMWASISSDAYYRFMGVLAVIVVLLTLVVPICSRLSPDKATQSNTLILRHEQGDVFSDGRGQRYRVSKV